MDQGRLARIVLGHRGKLERVSSIDPGSPDWLLIGCLRLAAVLHRARDGRGVPPITLAREGRGLSMNSVAGWLQKLPLTAAALEEEQRQWLAVGRGLFIRSSGARTTAG
jgi:exopolyphosphatase/guanosine-5'-triphosphate,3'-diphosphate pyrophosphatase